MCIKGTKGHWSKEIWLISDFIRLADEAGLNWMKYAIILKSDKIYKSRMSEIPKEIKGLTIFLLHKSIIHTMPEYMLIGFLKKTIYFIR